MTHDADRNLELTVNPAELAALGEGQVAYVKPVLSDDPALTSARLGLALGVRFTIAGALRLLGISSPERM